MQISHFILFIMLITVAPVAARPPMTILNTAGRCMHVFTLSDALLSVKYKLRRIL